MKIQRKLLLNLCLLLETIQRYGQLNSLIHNSYQTHHTGVLIRKETSYMPPHFTELGGSLPHSQVSTNRPSPSQINPFLCPSHFWQAHLFFLPAQDKDLSAPRYKQNDMKEWKCHFHSSSLSPDFLPIFFRNVMFVKLRRGGKGWRRRGGGCHVPDKYELFTLSLVLFFPP